MASTTQKLNRTANTDVYGLVRRINRFIVEIMKSQSSGVSQTISFDVQRARSYLAAVVAYHDWVVAQPSLDLPETGPTFIDLPAPPTVPMFENESLYDLCMLLELAREELANSQSSQLSSNLISFDSSRLMAIIGKASKFITDYVTVVDPLDQPETSPMTASTGQGLLGVNG
jgi:hypothetical protein